MCLARFHTVITGVQCVCVCAQRRASLRAGGWGGAEWMRNHVAGGWLKGRNNVAAGPRFTLNNVADGCRESCKYVAIYLSEQRGFRTGPIWPTTCPYPLCSHRGIMGLSIFPVADKREPLIGICKRADNISALCGYLLYEASFSSSAGRAEKEAWRKEVPLTPPLSPGLRPGFFG